MDPTDYDYRVFDITTEISRQVFPLSLDTDHPVFRAGMDRLCEISAATERAKARGGLIGTLQRGLCAVRAALCFGRIYLLPTKRHELPREMRVAPSW
jgi:magnesium-protoporphyrin IX monomethyl ester (oxidative) cyclase